MHGALIFVIVESEFPDHVLICRGQVPARHAPSVVPGRLEFTPDKRRTAGRSLSAADEEMIRKFGFDKDEYQRAMRG